MTAATRIVRALTLAEVETLVGWAAGEGWNPGLGDAAAFHAADPDGFLGAFIDGEMVAGISAVAYGDDYGFIGLYLCPPDHRGRGHGKAVWDAGLTRLQGRTIGLDGVAAQQANYRGMGFVPAYRTVRLSGRFRPGSPSGAGVRAVEPDMISAVLAYDRRCFPAARSAFLEQWLQPSNVALAVVIGGGIAGYGVMRRCREGFKIGPLFADSVDVADGLFSALASLSGASDVHIDVPETTDSFAKLLNSRGFSPGFETLRMYKGPVPATAHGGIFGITTLELG